LKSPALTLFELVERLALLTRAGLRESATDGALQPVHYQVLFYLNHANRFSNTPQALADYLGLTRGTVSQTVLVLARRKLVSRHSDAADGRVVRLALTEAGLACLGQLRVAQAWREAVAEVTPARLGSTKMVLAQVLDRVVERSGRRSFGVCSSCRHLQRLGPRTFYCGLLKDKLKSRETRLICREHQAGGAGV
jgi:DNA-binding MarR family transcriptional regulator